MPELPPTLRPASYYNPRTRMQAPIIIESGVLHHQITALSKLCTSQLCKIKDKAIKRGYNLKVSKLLLDAYVADEPRKGQSTISLNIIAMIEDIVTKNQMIRSYSCSAIAAKVATRLGVKKAVCAKSVYKVLKAKKYNSGKQTTKPRQTKEIKQARWD